MERERNREVAMFIGPMIHSTKTDEITIISKAVLVVVNGTIEVFEDASDDERLNELMDLFCPGFISTLDEGQFMIPGFVDCHLHAPQFPNAGVGYDRPLLEWLNAYTFPLESEYSDMEFANKVYTNAVKSTLACGTTTAVYFGTVHSESTLHLAELVQACGQRAFVGKVSMDRNCPVDMTETTEQSIVETERFILNVLDLKNDLIKPIITPRFAITCSEELLSQLGELAAKYNLPIQTHLAENKAEVEEVKRLFPTAKNYTDIYDQANLLTRESVVAHCVYLDETEMAVLKERGTSAVHCPNSNICLQSGLCDVRQLLNNGVNVALGTDVAGGCSHSMLDAIRSCLNTSTILSFNKPEYKPLNYQEAFYFATMGGAKALNMDQKLGNFEEGKKFDALVVDTKLYPMLAPNTLSISEQLQKFLYCGDDRNIVEVYVDGRLTKMSAIKEKDSYNTYFKMQVMF